MCPRCGRWRDSRLEIVRKVKEAIAPLDAAGDALANDGAGAAEGGDGGLAPRRVVRMDDGGLCCRFPLQLIDFIQSAWRYSKRLRLTPRASTAAV